MHANVTMEIKITVMFNTKVETCNATKSGNWQHLEFWRPLWFLSSDCLTLGPKLLST